MEPEPWGPRVGCGGLGVCGEAQRGRRRGHLHPAPRAQLSDLTQAQGQAEKEKWASATLETQGGMGRDSGSPLPPGGRGRIRMMGLGPLLRPREPPRPLSGKPEGGGRKQKQSPLRWEVQLSGADGGCCRGRRHKGQRPLLGPGGPGVAGVLCSVWWRVGGAGLGVQGLWGWSCPVPEESAPGARAVEGVTAHCSSSEDSCEMPSSSSFSSFLGLPLGFLPGAVAVFRVLAAPLFLLPFGRPRGLLGVGTSLGSFGGCLRGRPRPRFSVPSFSCLEAKGWLDLELDSLIFPSLQLQHVEQGGWGARARPPACRERRCWALRPAWLRRRRR